MRRLGEMLGFAAGGLEGALVGGGAARGGSGGRGWRKARVATGGARPNRNVVPGVVGGDAAPLGLCLERVAPVRKILRLKIRSRCLLSVGCFERDDRSKRISCVLMVH